ncbi:MAG: molybdenum cofactor biosynthesis protein MoaE [Methanobrevibacter sp.]|jgi:molybdopterin synthase catalytic subunit|nr:molybdenum cofactor biosynthesis protein MoaE [Methanobrevibacter sp.]
MLVKIVEKDEEYYKINDLVDTLKKNEKIDESGAMFTFEGFVRGKEDDQEIKDLTLTLPDKEKTEKELIEAIKDIEEKYCVYEIATVHYIGKFFTGDTLFLVGVLGSHRDKTLKALSAAIEKIKYGFDFKKEEVSNTGTRVILAGG